MRRLSTKLALVWGVAVGLGLACSTANPPPYPAHPLVDQILKVRPGHEGVLTNRSCAANDPATGYCTQAKIQEYPLADPAFRETANRLNFLCNIGGKRYKICKDKPGFCRIGYLPKCFLVFCQQEEVELDYLPVGNYQFLLDAAARCANKEEYNLWSQAAP